MLLEINEAAKVAKVSSCTIRRLIAAGRLRASNYGTGTRRATWRIDPADLTAVTAPPPPGEPPADAPLPTPRPRRHRERVASAASTTFQIW